MGFIKNWVTKTLKSAKGPLENEVTLQPSLKKQQTQPKAAKRKTNKASPVTKEIKQNSPFSPNKADEKIKKLSKEATALKKTKIQKAVKKLYQVKALYSEAQMVYPVSHYLRLPLFLQQAKVYAKAIEECEDLLKQFDNPFDKKAIYEKMQLMAKREKVAEDIEKYSKLAESNIKSGKGVKRELKAQWKKAVKFKETRPYICIEPGSTPEPCPYHSKIFNNTYLIEESLWDELISGLRPDIRCNCRFRALTKRELKRKKP